MEQYGIVMERMVINQLLVAQQMEITEYHIYQRLAGSMSVPHNKEVLEKIADAEMQHYDFLKQFTREDCEPNWMKVWKYAVISKLFGITFAIKLMEGTEGHAKDLYLKLSESRPEISTLIPEEDAHEKELIALIDEDRLKYLGALVLGLNDALVELTGTLAGLTLAFQQTRLIAIAGLITGIAASLSMAASEYLSTKSEAGTLNPVKAALYTGSTYIFTVLLLIAPYLVFESYILDFALTLSLAITVIFLFTYYVSVARDLSFKKRFVEMAVISFGVALISFILGALVRDFFNISI